MNRKGNKCWFAEYSCDLFTYQYIGRKASWLQTSTGYDKYCGIGRLSVVSSILNKLLVGFKQKILKAAFESMRNKFP